MKFVPPLAFLPLLITPYRPRLRPNDLRTFVQVSRVPARLVDLTY
jgi:hypothetical protein